MPSTNQHPVLLQAGCPSCRPTNSVKALKGKQPNQNNQEKKQGKEQNNETQSKWT